MMKMMIGAARMLASVLALAPAVGAPTALAIASTMGAPPADPLAASLALPLASGMAGADTIARFAWIETAAGIRNIWIADPGRPAHRLTDYQRDDGVALADLAFSRDGTSLAFVRGGDPEFPDDRPPNAGLATAAPEQMVFRATLDGSDPVAVGQGHAPVFSPSGDTLAFVRGHELWLAHRADQPVRIATVGGEISRLAWSPDATKLLFVESRRDHSLIALLDPASRRLDYLRTGLGFAVEPVFSPDGARIAFIFFREPPAGAAPDAGPFWSIGIADGAGGNVRTIWRAPAGRGAIYAGTRGQNLFWGAGDRLIFPWEASGWLHPYAIAASGGAAADLTPGQFEVESFLLAPDRRTLVYAANAGDLDRRHVWQVAIAHGTPIQRTTGSGSESYPLFGGDTLAAIATGIAHPAFAAIVGSQLTPLASIGTAAGFVAPAPIIVTAEDGVASHGQFFQGKGAGPHPALLFVHGGPRRQMLLGFHPSAYYSNAYILNQHFAAQGYDVLSINYRSGTGFGLAFRDAPGIGRDGATEYRDILAAGRWLAARHDVDPRRIGIWGGSWGGYLTALALARNSALFAAGVDFHGVHTLLRTVENNLSPDAQAAARQLQWRASPLAAIGTWRSPVLLIHGDDDRNVDFGQSLLLARELAARNLPFEELVFPNERHGFVRYGDWLASYRAADEFLARRLAAAP